MPCSVLPAHRTQSAYDVWLLNLPGYLLFQAIQARLLNYQTLAHRAAIRGFQVNHVHTGIQAGKLRQVAAARLGRQLGANYQATC